MIGQRARCGIDRFGGRGLGDRIGRADRHEFERGLAIGIDADEFGDRRVRESQYHFGGKIERVSGCEQVRNHGSGVPEGVSKGARPILPGVYCD